MFTMLVRVYFEDTDAGGVVYYANYLKFMERARTEFLRSLGFDQSVLQRDMGRQFVVCSVSMDFHKPARLDDMLQLETQVVHCARVSVRFCQRVMWHNKSLSSEPLCTANIKVACVDALSLRPAAIPTDLLLALSAAITSPETGRKKQ